MKWGKTHLINELAAIHGYRAYLEICTPTTGNEYAFVDRSRYTTCHRLMYRCPDAFDDGLPIDARTAGDNIDACIGAVGARRSCYDAILVDSYHDYQSSARDLRAAVALIGRNGTIVVHDCFPRNEALAQPSFQADCWCGVTYKAYLDVVLDAARLQFCTVDVDYGCGVVRRRPLATSLRRVALGGATGDATGNIVGQWRRIGDDNAAAFRLLQAHAKPLLNLVTVDEFLAGERNGAPVLR